MDLPASDKRHVAQSISPPSVNANFFAVQFMRAHEINDTMYSCRTAFSWAPPIAVRRAAALSPDAHLAETPHTPAGRLHNAVGTQIAQR